MKRFITIITGCIFLGYVLMSASNIAPSFFTKPFLGKAVLKVRGFIGFGAYFVKINSPTGKSATYRFYQNGKWQSSQKLLEPLFEDYRSSGNIAALKHCRLDAQLISGVCNLAKKSGIPKMKRSAAYAEFIDHLIYRHNLNTKPDSLEIGYYLRDYKTDSLHLSVTFKIKP